MRLKTALILLALASPNPVSGAVNDAASSRKDQVQAATSNAVNALEAAVSLEQITPELTVKDFLDKTKSRERLIDTLRRSQQIGGPRWVDKTCEVRLEISGARARAALVQIATTESKTSPLAGDVLSLRLKDWDKRSFGATGSSASAIDLPSVKPAAENDVWASVGDDARRVVLEAAKNDATSRALMNINDVELQPGMRVEDALKDKAVQSELQTWLQARPVTAIEFREDRQVHVTVNSSPEEFAAQVRKSLDAHGKKIGDEDAWARATEAFVAKLGSTGLVEGTAGLSDKRPPATTAAAALPALPPAWVSEQREAEGASRAGGSKLKAARSAEADAMGKLSTQVNDLPLLTDTTVGQAAERDPQLSLALARAMAHAKTYKVDYLSDGSAKVKLSINLSDVWNELQAGY